MSKQVECIVVGGSCVNAVSELFEVRSRRKEKEAYISFEKGIKKNLTFKTNTGTVKGHKTGTLVKFKLDDSLFSGEISKESLIKMLKETAYLNTGLKITFLDNVEKSSVTSYQFNNGIQEYLESKVEKDAMIFKPVYFTDTINDVKIEIAFTYTNAFEDENITSFVNTINTSEHGTHVTGFKRALSQYLGKYIKDNNLIKEEIQPEDFREGLNAIVSIFVYHPKYETQTKQRLKNNDVNGHVFKAASEGIKTWLDKNAKDIKNLAQKISINIKGRLAKKRAVEQIKKESSSMLSSLGNIGKFTDCIEDSECTLFICEGDSAQGTLINGRDKNTQAIYALKGKPLNVLELDTHRVLDNKEINDLISVLKCGYKEGIDISKTKFSKIVFLADADIDGKTIFNKKTCCHKTSLIAGNSYH